MSNDRPAEVERGGIQVIARAASILRALEAEPLGLSLGELANRTGLARSTVQRIVGALIDENILMSAGVRAGVTLGPALVRLAAAANIATDRLVRPVLMTLSRDLGETVDLSSLQGRTAVFVDQVIGSSRLVAISAVGAAFPLHCTANGKALLSCLSPDRIGQLIVNKLAAHTGNSITSLSVLQAEIAKVRVVQLAYDIEEHSEGICAIGTAFIDALGRDFAISVPVPTARFEQKRDAIAKALAKARNEVLRLLPGASLPTV